MLGPTIYIPSGLAKLLIPLTSFRAQMLPAPVVGCPVMVSECIRRGPARYRKFRGTRP